MALNHGIHNTAAQHQGDIKMLSGTSFINDPIINSMATLPQGHTQPSTLVAAVLLKIHEAASVKAPGGPLSF